LIALFAASLTLPASAQTLASLTIPDKLKGFGELVAVLD